MRNFLFILGLLISAMIFVPEEETKSWDHAQFETQETFMEENDQNEAQRHFEVLSNELKSSNCLTPRRISQTSGQSFHLRTLKTMEKHLHCIRLRNENLLHKVFKQTSFEQTVTLSTLACRKAEHVFTLRKLII